MNPGQAHVAGGSADSQIGAARASPQLHPITDIPDHLLRQLRRARRSHAIAWAEAGAAMYPGIMFTAHLADILISYEADQNGVPRRV